MTDYWESLDYHAVSTEPVMPLQTAANAIYIWVSPFLLLCGTIGNILSLLVLARLCQEVISTCLYLAILAVVDLLLLFTRCGNDWLERLIGLDLNTIFMVYSNSICKVYPFLFNFLFHMSRWLLVCVALETVIIVKHPHRVSTMCTLSRARVVMLLLTVLLICINAQYFWSFDRVTVQELGVPESGQTWLCTFNRVGQAYIEEFQNIVWPIMDTLVAEIIPYIIITACLVTIGIQLVHRKRNRYIPDVRAKQRYHGNDLNKNQQGTTFSVLLLCFFPFTLPKFGYFVFNYLVERTEIIEYTLSLQVCQELVHAVCASLEYCFLGLKIIVYVVTSEQFRLALRGLFSCKHRSRVHKTTTFSNKPLLPMEQGEGRCDQEQGPSNAGLAVETR